MEHRTTHPLHQQLSEGFAAVSETLSRPLEYYHRWRYKNTALLLGSVGIFFYFLGSDTVQSGLRGLGDLGYFGAFATGIFFTSAFTVAPAGVALYAFADTHNPYLIATLAGAGAVIGDYLILKLFKDRVFSELTPLMNDLGGSFFRALFRSPYFSWVLPLIGAAMIASPVVPDEIGIGLLGLSKVSTWRFVLITFALNAIGIFLIVTAARIL